MVKLCVTVVVIYLVIAIYKSSTWTRAYRKVTKAQNKSKQYSVKKDKLPHMFLCIPGLREQSILQETMEYFDRFYYPKELLTIMLITTEKENYQKNKRMGEIRDFVQKVIDHPEDSSFYNNGLFSRKSIPEVISLIDQNKENPTRAYQVVEEYYQSFPTTETLIQRILKEHKFHNKFVHLHYPETKGGKPEQLNYALQYIEQMIKDKKVEQDRCFIGVYDFDARPDRRTGKELEKLFLARIHTKKEMPSMIQQIQLPYSNLVSFDKKSLEGMLLRSNAIMYLRRALGIEYYKFQKMNQIFHKPLCSAVNVLRRPVTYGIGSGMYVSYNALKRIGDFPTPMEDLATGYRISMLGEEMIPLNSLNMMEAYDSYKQMSNSGSISFRGAFRIIKDYQIMLELDKANNLNKAEKFALVVKEWGESTIWMVGNIILLLSYIYLIVKFGCTRYVPLLITPLLIRFCFDSLGLNIAMEKICMQYEGIKLRSIKSSMGNKLLIALISPVQGVMRMIAPFKALRYLFQTCLLKKNVEQSKTER